MMKTLMLLTVCLFGCVATFAQDAQNKKFTAEDLWTNCRNADLAVQHKAYKDGWKKTDKTGTQEVFYAGMCYGYIRGWMEGRDLTQASLNGKLYTIHVLDVKSLNDVYIALDKWLREKPLDKGKLADAVLFNVFIDAKLINPEEVGSATIVSQAVQ